MAKRQNIISVVDIGSSKISTITALVDNIDRQALEERDLSRNFEVIGIGQVDSYGIKKGEVVQTALAKQALKSSILEAEKSSGVKIKSVYTAMSDLSVTSVGSYGMCPVKHKEIVIQDVTNVIQASKAIPLGDNLTILHIFPESFSIDGKDPVKNPIGEKGVRLEVKSRLITASSASIQALLKLFVENRLHVDRVVASVVAFSKGIASNEEQLTGCCVINLGAGKSQIAVLKDQVLKSFATVPVGGNYISNDLALGLNLSFTKAEEIKRKIVNDISRNNNLNLEIEYNYSDPKDNVSVTQNDIVRIVRPRVVEIFSSLVSTLNSGSKVQGQELEEDIFLRYGIQNLILLGGQAEISGIKEVARDFFGIHKDKIRIGEYLNGNDKLFGGTHPISQNSPSLATAYGVLSLYMKGDIKPVSYSDNRLEKRSLFRSVGEWFGSQV